LIFVFLLCICSFCVAQEKKLFTFYSFFEGDWDVYRATADIKSSEQVSEEVIVGHYSISRENETSNLIGRYFENDTTSGGIFNEMDLYIEFDDPNSGRFKTSNPDLEDEDHLVLFEFGFHEHANGMALSLGPYHANQGSTYKFVVASFDKFALMITPPEGELQLYLGKRIPVIQEKTFFQKYSTFIMIGGVLLFQIFMKRSVGPQLNQAQQSAGPARPAAGARARVEDIPTESSSSSAEPAAAAKRPKSKGRSARAE